MHDTYHVLSCYTVDTMKRCCTCHQDLPDGEFSRHAGGKRCRACSREAASRARARKRDRKTMLRIAYEITPPKDFPQFYEVLQDNMRALVAAIKVYAGTHNVIIPMDRFPQTGYPVDDRLRLYPGPGTEPILYVDLDGVRGEFRLSDKPLHLFAAWLTERYAVLGEPKLGGAR